MSLPVPNLDDRTFVDLVLAARERIARSCPEWTDRSAHDPGMVLVETFAYLTEIMLYRLNRLPEKAYVAFLNLLGVTRHPPAAAWTELTFTRASGATGAGPGPAAAGDPVPIPTGTRVAAARGVDPEPVIFITTESVAVPAGEDSVTVRAHHCALVEAELLGIGTGQPGQRFHASQPPIVTTADPLDLLLGVEVPPGSLGEGAVAREHAGRTFEIWQPVRSFADAGPQARVYLLDRASGTVTFAPALDARSPGTTLAAVPPADREIRLWYRTGGGPAGNVAAGTLTNLRDPIPGIRTVTNASPARGGRALEPIEAAVARGPYEVFSLQRAVTARDFEVLATANTGAVARAKAFTRAAVWSFAQPGAVEVVLVPHIGDEARPAWRLPLPVLLEHQVDTARQRVATDLDRRRSLGTSCVTTWVRAKEVAVVGRVVVRAEEDPDAVRRRIHDRLYQAISPLPTPLSAEGWPFGQPLRASNVYRMLEQAEPGVSYVDEVRFVVNEAPDGEVTSVASDRFQPDTWYAGCGELLFRSTNAGQGWEPVGRFPGETVRRVVPAPAPARPGIVPRPGAAVVVTRKSDGGNSGVHVTTDLGETWRKVAELQPGVHDAAWVDRDQAGALLLATDTGLYELSLLPGSVPLQVLVERDDPNRGFYAVASFVSERGAPGVAVASQAQHGVYLSTTGGQPGTFTNVGLTGVDTRTMAVQFDGPSTTLWVGAGEPDPNRAGQGCFRARLFEADVQWAAVSADWGGGTCWGLAFAGVTALAATQSGGVLRLDTSAAQPAWQAAHVNCGLPLRDRPRFMPVQAVAAGVSPTGPVLAGGPQGVYRSPDAFLWTAAADRETRDAVTIPDTWLLCSGEHRIEVVVEGGGDATPGH
jgi:hypothetical protein